MKCYKFKYSYIKDMYMNVDAIDKIIINDEAMIACSGRKVDEYHQLFDRVEDYKKECDRLRYFLEHGQYPENDEGLEEDDNKNDE